MVYVTRRESVVTIFVAILVFSGLTVLQASAATVYWSKPRPYRNPSSPYDETIANAQTDGIASASLGVQISDYIENTSTVPYDMLRLKVSALANSRKGITYTASDWVWGYPWYTVSNSTGITTDNRGNWLTLPFTVLYYGVEYNRVWVSDNGFLSFDYPSNSSTPESIPNTNKPNSTVAVFWRDLDPEASGASITYGEVSDDQIFRDFFVVSWNNIPNKANGARQTFQVAIGKRDPPPGGDDFHNWIIFKYGSITKDISPTTVGVEDQVGEKATSYDYNTLANGRGLKFESQGKGYRLDQLSIKLSKSDNAASIIFDHEHIVGDNILLNEPIQKNVGASMMPPIRAGAGVLVGEAFGFGAGLIWGQLLVLGDVGYQVSYDLAKARFPDPELINDASESEDDAWVTGLARSESNPNKNPFDSTLAAFVDWKFNDPNTLNHTMTITAEARYIRPEYPYDFLHVSTPPTTLKMYINYAPANPTFWPPDTARVYTNYTYQTSTSDQNGDRVKYEFNWGDGTPNTNTSLQAQGTVATAYHTWTRPANLTVSVRAIDEYEATSGWINRSITVTQNDAGSAADAGGDFNSAFMIIGGSYTGTLYGSTNPRDDDDYYKVTLNVGWTISVTMTPPPGVNFDLKLYTPSGNPIEAPEAGPGQTESITHIADVYADWRINIHDPWYGDGQYSFTVSVTTPPPPPPPEGGGCPYVWTWNGTQYVIDNNILPASERSNGNDVQDYYQLEQSLLPRNGTYSLFISEFEHEHSYIDQVKLLAVDHASDVKIAVDPNGQILTYKNPIAPVYAIDNYGTSRLNEIRSMDGDVSNPATFFYGNASDYLVLNFGRVSSDNAKLILRDDYKSDEVCIDVQVLNRYGQWQTVTTVTPRAYWAIEGVDLSRYVVRNRDFKVRLLWTSPHRLDFAGLDTTRQASYQITYATLVSATHSTQGNVTTLLTTNDNVYAELLPGQQMQIDFTLPDNQQEARTYILYTEGHYYTIP